MFEVTSSVVHSKTKQRIKDVWIPYFSEKNTSLFFIVIPTEVLEILLLRPCPPTSIEWNGSNCSTIRINIQAIMLAKGAANHIYVDCQIHYYKQMAVLAVQCSWEKTDIISN